MPLDPKLPAKEIIRLLGLKPHPEGGHFRETFRDPHRINGRSASTAIYFLLAAHERSHWHRVDAVEIWHWHAGAPLKLEICPVTSRSVERLTLGSRIEAGEQPQILVPKMAWQAAETLGAWTLTGCTVAPGFEFSGFELAPKDFNPGTV